MNKSEVIDMYVNEILKVNGDKDKLAIILKIVIENTERQCSINIADAAYDFSNKVGKLKSWKDE